MAGRILILDPVPTNRMVLKSKLSLAHYDVSVADSVPQARELIGRHRFEAILISTALVEIPAECALAWMHSLRGGQGAAATFLFMHDAPNSTANCDVLEKCLSAGADDVLNRPFSEEVLLARIRNLMRDNAHTHDLHPPSIQPSMPLEEMGQSDRPSVNIAIAHIPAHPPFTGGNEVQKKIVAIEQRMRGTDRVSSVSVSMLMQPDESPCEPEVVVLVAEAGATEHALSIMCQMRSRTRMHDVRIMLLLAAPSAKDVARAFDLGAHDVVALDVRSTALIARINKQARVHGNVRNCKRLVRESLVQAVTDPLTGLYNRRYATTRLEKMQRDCLATGSSFAILAFDVDHFKDVNDSYGHAVGDAVLTTLAKTLRLNLRESDLICRTGGEEFMVALPNTDRAEASATANRLRKAVGALDIAVQGYPAPLRVTVSVGLSIQDGSKAISDMLEQTDRALYQAKARGRNVVAIVAAA
ncbi:diguanylate cyclase [Litoreibacter janthinus]|uniref:diguanylate cyclase n=1 Tax=Litoreibacter janthinus TaxID=670154 RepID=A0A1I6HSR1_9RHOB|nr:diguanylate cyclase [Litoreibacter janthinus]SFR57464.1 two-component system, cell cycle response regulator [Litoreibacter janthinus]